MVPQLEQCCCGCELRTGTKFVGWIGAIFGTIAFIFYLLVATGAIAYGDTADKDVPMVHAAVIFLITSAVLRTLLSISLLIGVYKEKISYYLPWIIYSTVALVLAVIFVIVMIIGNSDVPTAIGTFIQLCIDGYFILVVYSDYRQQKERGRGGH